VLAGVDGLSGEPVNKNICMFNFLLHTYVERNSLKQTAMAYHFH
jgi:hypothetical protein